MSVKNQFPFNSIFLIGGTLVLPIFAKKSVVEVFIYIVWSLFGVLYVFFDKIGVEIRKVEEKK